MALYEVTPTESTDYWQRDNGEAG